MYRFFGTYLIYRGQKIPLNDTTFLLDGSPGDHSDAGMAEECKWVYRSLPELAEAVNCRKREAERMGGRCAVTVYINGI